MPGITKASKSKLPLNLLSIAKFIEFMDTIKRPKVGQGFVYEATFLKDQEPHLDGNHENGDAILSIKEQADLAAVYTQVVMGITLLILFDFNVLGLTIIEAADFSGVSISFYSPSDQLFTHRYVREGDDKSIFPKDFLYDLIQFPRRYK